MRHSFELRPSRYLAAILGAAHGAALAALIPLAFPAWAKAALGVVILFSLWYHLRRDAWLAAPSSGMALTLESGHALLATRDGKPLAGPVLRDSVVTPRITVLNMAPEGARFARSVIILPDSLDAESFRQLRVWLKWGM